jgi:UDP-glucose 4-epimerase
MIALVTGGCGFIGSQIVKELQEIATEIRILDNMSSGKRENLTGLKYTLIKGCITDKKCVSKVMDSVTHVFHCAALISVADSSSYPQDYEYINTIGTITLLDAAVKAKVSSFVLSSSCSVYGNDTIVLRNEKSSLNPVSPYALTKVHCENYCKYYYEQFGLNTACLRYFNVYGSKQDPDKNYAAAVPIFIKKIINKEPIIIYGDGNQTRDFIHVIDIARANIHAAVNNLNGVYNVGSGESINIINLAKTIMKILKTSTPILYENTRMGDIRYIDCDNKKLMDTRFKLNYSLINGLIEMVTELRK